MAEIGCEHRVQPCAVVFGRERERPQWIVGFATEIATVGEYRADVGGGAHAAARELVETSAVFVGFAQHVQCVVELVCAFVDLRCRVPFEQCAELRAIEARRVVGTDCVTVTFLEVADEVGAQRCRPRNTPFEKRETHFGKAVEHAAEEQRTAQRFPRRAERTDVIRHVVRR